MIGAERRRRSLAYDLKTRVAAKPTLALPLARFRHHGVVLSDATEVVIEGYPRSANSFSVVAFEVAQGRRTGIAHHTHAPAHVLEAVKRRVPTIVLARDPAEAAVEFLLVRRELTAPQALLGYVRFYEPLLIATDGFVVGLFPQVTSDFGVVMSALNRRSGSTFTPFEHTEANVRRCFDAMQDYWEGRVGGGDELERRVGRPSEQREAMKRELRPLLDEPDAAELLAHARHLYEAFGTLAREAEATS
jgi:hypothetical protein